MLVRVRFKASLYPSPLLDVAPASLWKVVFKFIKLSTLVIPGSSAIVLVAPFVFNRSDIYFVALRFKVLARKTFGEIGLTISSSLFGLFDLSSSSFLLKPLLLSRWIYFNFAALSIRLDGYVLQTA